MKRPVTVFITFETEENMLKAKKISGKVEWMGEMVVMEPAPEPTDIIWENRHFTDRERFVRLLITVGSMFLLLGVTFCTIFYLKKYLQANKYSSNINCDEVGKLFRDETHYQEYAMRDWYNSEASEGTKKMTGALQCFCQRFQKNYGFYKTIN